jgi:hypothetical protein
MLPYIHPAMPNGVDLNRVRRFHDLVEDKIVLHNGLSVIIAIGI